jgi:methyl coenzyme M reductase subunit C-like uncharacterized protein (methanogenesis marker protein 7)
MADNDDHRIGVGLFAAVVVISPTWETDSYGLPHNACDIMDYMVSNGRTITER